MMGRDRLLSAHLTLAERRAVWTLLAVADSRLLVTLAVRVLVVMIC